MKSKLLKLFTILAGLYVLVVAILYFQQERLLFPGDALPKDYTFSFKGDFKELNIPVDDNININGLLFTAKNTKGLIFYLHGNGGNLSKWGDIATLYNKLGYDIFIPDYRGYGKSGGEIESEAQLYKDMQIVYNTIKTKYSEQNIVIIGYSIGTGTAAKLASINAPKLLILTAPYYSLTNVIDKKVPFMPHFLQKYKFQTHKCLEKVESPIYIFHGTNDKIIHYSNSVQLKNKFPEKIDFTTLQGAGHDVNNSYKYLDRIIDILK